MMKKNSFALISEGNEAPVSPPVCHPTKIIAAATASLRVRDLAEDAT